MALKEIVVDWDTFNFRVYCVIGAHRCLKAYVKRRHKRVYKAARSANTAGLYFASVPSVGGILWLEEIPRTPETIGYLAHEMGHAVMDMHEEKRINIDPMNDETFCYAVGHGVQKVLEGLKKK